MDAGALLVTTSCFSVWSQNGKTNGFAKVIPAVPARHVSGNVKPRVFFFDDNIEMKGLESSPGICNLRDVATGDFVDFGVGMNGFSSETVASHTVVHHSSAYRNVLVKVNILDAMEDPEYFTKILERFSEPDEKALVFMDVNSSIMCADSTNNRGLSSVLLSTLFEFFELRPHDKFEFQWDARPKLEVAKKISLKDVVKKISKGDADYYNGFYDLGTCLRFFTELSKHGTVRWTSTGDAVTPAGFAATYEKYIASTAGSLSEHGITQSWFRLYDALQVGQHTTVLNSFGIDTQTIVRKTVPDDAAPLQLTVNHSLWEQRDKEKFEQSFA